MANERDELLTAVRNVLLAHGMPETGEEPEQWPGTEPEHSRTLHNLWVVWHYSSIGSVRQDSPSLILFTYEALSAHRLQGLPDDESGWVGSPEQVASFKALHTALDAYSFAKRGNSDG